MSGQPTYPHDYRVVCEVSPAPLVVGGQAVCLWAINYLDQGRPSERSVRFASKDLDLVASEQAIAFLRNIPGWEFQQNDTKNWLDSRVGFLVGHSSDGRPLLVEVLHSVHGLDEEDLKAAAFVAYDGEEARKPASPHARRTLEKFGRPARSCPVTMNSLDSHKLTSIAALAVAIFAPGSLAHAADDFRNDAHVAHRAPVLAFEAHRPAGAVLHLPARSVTAWPAPARGYPAPRPFVPVTARGRESSGWHWHGFWGRR